MERGEGIQAGDIECRGYKKEPGIIITTGDTEEKEIGRRFTQIIADSIFKS